MMGLSNNVIDMSKKVATANGAPPYNNSFLGDLHASANKNCDKIFASWYNSQRQCTLSYSYSRMWQEAGVVSHYLRRNLGLAKGDLAILCYSPGLPFFAAFLGCLRAGVVAIPMYPPDSKNLERSMEKMELVLKDCGAKLILVDSLVEKLFLLAKIKGAFSLRRFSAEIKVHPKPKKISNTYDEPAVTDEDLAFLQYTSGSTSDPKGVMITLRALRANTKSIVEYENNFGKLIGFPTNELKGFSWLPQYHDLGLIHALIAPFIGGWNCNMISPLDFLRNPILWVRLMSDLKVNWSVAPNFAFCLTARKFEDFKQRYPSLAASVDLSSIVRLGCGAEPVPAETKFAFENAFGEYGLRKDWFSSGYGLAEVCVNASILHEFRLSSDQKFVAVANRSTFHRGQMMKIVDPDSHKELSDGKTGEIWIAGPSVAKGYFKNEELSSETFGVTLKSPSDDRTYLRTGDLGFYEDSFLFVCGRIKDLIIVNGRNLYPQDVEHEVEKTDKDAVRPGCVAAFSSDDSGGSGELEIVFEIRKDHEKECEKITEAVCKRVSKQIGLTPSRIVAFKERTIFKTTSGKIQRKKNRTALRDGTLSKHMLFDWTKGNADNNSQSIDIPENLPTELPCAAFEAIERIRCDEHKLERIFDAFRVRDLPGVDQAWSLADKSSNALQSMCIQSLKGFLPPMVQFVNLLSNNMDWLLVDGSELLSNFVHHAFVIEWITNMLVTNVEILEEKFRLDDKHEAQLLKDVDESLSELPEDARFFAEGNTHDALFGAIDLFGYMKLRSVSRCLKMMTDSVKEASAVFSVENEGTEGKCIPGSESFGVQGEDVNWLTVNILEAIWVDWLHDRQCKYAVGQSLIESSQKVRVDFKHNDGTLKMQTIDKGLFWAHYAGWNMSLVMSFPNTEVNLALLLIPSLLNHVKSGFYLHHRVVSLYIVLQMVLDRELQNESSPLSFSEVAVSSFGELNRRWISQHNSHTSADATNFDDIEAKELCENWMKRFNEWSKKKLTVFDVAAMNADEKFDSIVQSFFGKNVDFDSSWDDIGMTSIVSIQLRDAISESMSSNIEMECFETYNTPASLKKFLRESTGVPLEISKSDIFPISSMHLPWLVLTLFQAVGSLFVLFLLSFCILTTFQVGVAVDAFSSGSIAFKWIVVPLMIPFWMALYSVIVIVLKWCIIGRYKEGIINVQSLAYFRWWIVDRALDVWEIWIGRFFLGTPLLNLHYCLLGAKIHQSVYFNAFIREFDLVSIGKESTINSSISCRKFGVWNEENQATVRIRQIKIANSCTIKGILSPGASIGEFACVDNLSCVTECSVVPSKKLATSNPAFVSPAVTPQPSMPHCWWKVGILKCAWLIFEMYHFAVIFEFGNHLWTSYISFGWRYDLILKWLLLFLWVSFVSALTSIAIKWILIGKRRPGPVESCLLRKVKDDCADFHFNLGHLFYTFCDHSRFLNAVLMLHGMDVDLSSKFYPSMVLPSSVDLIKIRNSFVSVVSFNTESEDEYKQITISGSSVGIWSHISNGSEIANSIVPPMSNISGKQLFGSGHLDERNKFPNSTVCKFIWDEACFCVLFFVNLGILFASLIPSYELWRFIFPESTCAIAATIGICILLQAFALSILLSVLERAALVNCDESGEPWSWVLYCSYQHLNFAFNFYSFASVLKGSQPYNLLMRILGAKFEGQAILFPENMYEHKMLSFAEKSIVDCAFVMGHFAVYNELVTGHCRIQGTVHRETTVAIANLTERESGPCRSYVNTPYQENKMLIPFGEGELGQKVNAEYNEVASLKTQITVITDSCVENSNGDIVCNDAV